MTTPPEPPSILQSIPAAVEASLASVPADKRGVLVMGVEWKYGLPFAKFGTALKVGDNFKLAADAETRFSKLSTSAKAYAVWSW
ncbi:MAG: hypothetical protein Q8O42_09470 [Acidobacteriota bacterium]|nr:hypothetical protein [Acidobacteriota bacterium]